MRLEQLEDRTTPAIIQNGVPDYLSAGPAPITGEGNVVVPGDFDTGAVKAIATDPFDPNIAFVGAVNGGVWRTGNAMAATPTWTPLTDQMPSLTIGAISLNPANHNQLLVGVGAFSSAARIGEDLIGAMYTENALDPNPTFRVLSNNIAGMEVSAVIARTGYLLVAGQQAFGGTPGQSGVYVSTDNGVTFKHLNGAGGLPLASNNDVYDAVADPASPNRVYVIGRFGIYRTDDVTATVPTWTAVTPGPFAEPAVQATADVTQATNAKLAIHATAAGNVVYAAVATNAPNGTSFFRVIWSTDLGTTWTPMDEATLVSNTIPIQKVSDFGTNPIKITSPGHGLATGDRVYIQGVSGNLGANGVWTVTRTDQDNFTLDGSAATGNWTGGGTWQKVFGVGVGNQADIHMAIAADPTNPNLVYISGDRQDTFPFAGSIMRGDRTAPRSFGSTPTSPQWTPIVFAGAAGGTAPHADSRALVFDAAGNLLEGDDGGIYKRTNPQTSTGGWTSINGNLSINQIYSVRLDTVNHTLFAGSQDTGANVQVSGAGPTGSQLWRQEQTGDGTWQGVDNTSTPFSSIHYVMSNTIETFNRYVYDNNNKLVSRSAVFLASPATPTKYESALDASDKGSSFINVFDLNVIDPRQMLLAMRHLYEDNDPSGNAGDVIADITPAGYSGRGSAVVYGGKQLGVSFSRIAYVGTTTGQLWIRGAADGFYQGNLPGSGSVDGIGVDPDNWRVAYVLRGNHVYLTDDAGLSFTDVTQNLLGTGIDATGNVVGGLTNALTTLTVYDPNPGTAAGGVVVLVGGQGGVFRFYPGLNNPNVTTGNWSEFGAGLPNAIVSDLRVYGNELVVGTQGRGAWVVPDVSSTITAKSVVQIMGTAGNDVMTIQADPSNPQYVIVSDGQGNVRRFQETQVQGFQIVGLGGADTAQILASGVAGGDTHFVKYPISVDLGGDAGDTLMIRNAAAPSSVFVTVTAGSVGGGVGDSLLGANGSITYAGLQKGSLVLDLGADAQAGNMVNVQATSAGATGVLGGAKVDSFIVNSAAGDASVGGTLDDIFGELAFDGRGGGDRLVVSDIGATAGNANVALVPGGIRGMAGPTDASDILYSNILNLVVYGSNNPQVAEQYTVDAVDGPTAPLDLSTLDGPDVVNVRAMSQPANINTGAGNDLIRVSSVAGVNDDGDLSQIRGLLAVDAGPGDNQLIVSDYGSPVGGTVNVTAQQITAGPIQLGYAASGGRFFSPLGNGILIRGSNAGGDRYFVQSTLVGSQTVIDGAGGNDAFNAAMQTLAGDVQLRGGGGDDAFQLSAGALGNQANNLLVSGGGQGGDAATLSGFAGADDNAGIAVTSTATAQATGLGRTVNFDTLGRVVYDGLSGRNSLTFTDATGAGHGSIGDPLAGVVYAPSGETSGRVSVGGGAVGPLVDFRNVSGADVGGLVVNADPTGQRRGVVTVLGASDAALGSQFGEATGPSGVDDVTVSDQGVLLHNDSLGYLRAVTLAQVNGAPAASTLIVKTGNEAGPGDRVTVRPSSVLNILVDGGRGRNSLTFDSPAAATLVHVADPTVAPFQSRYQFSDGTSFGFTNFQGGSGAQNIVAVGADVGGGPRVRVLDAATQNVLFDGFVYSPNFTGGVRVATGDVTGDGVPDLITAAGIGGGPHIQVFDGTDFVPVASFFAYEPTFTSGLYVTVGDVDGDGVDDIITGTGAGGGPLVKVFDYKGNQKDAFFAYDPNFRGGVRVGAGDINGDGTSEIITGAGVGGGPQVTVFSFPTNAIVESYFATDPSYRGGIFVTAGDMDGDGKAEIAAGPGTDQAAQVVNILRSSDGSMASLNVADTGAINTAGTLPATPMLGLAGMNSPTQLTGGLRLAMIPGADGRDQLAVARGPGFVPRVHLYTLDPLQEVGNFVPFELEFEGGIFVG
jgi:hypothetical protein